MKKILCLFIGLIVLLGSISALAEEFALHSGVQFGMTVDEVVELEEKSGFECKVYDENSEYSGLGPNEHEVRVEGKIASIDESSIEYYFVDNALTIAWYEFGNSGWGGFSYSPDDFDTVETALVNKYGEPNCPTGLFDSFAFTDDVESITHCQECDVYGDCDIYGLSNWLIPLNDNACIFIEHYLISAEFVDDPSFADGYHTLCYQVMDATEVKSVLQNAADEFLDNSQQLEDDI